MTWRPTDRVESGELDNTVRGRVTDWIRLFGRLEPLTLELRGDCHPDLAGWRFRIVRRAPVPDWAEAVALDGLATEQFGEVGDITADQLLRHHNCSVEELLDQLCAGEQPPSDLRKALCIEWNSTQNGRVVIQDTRLGVARVGVRTFELPKEDLHEKAESAQRQIDTLRHQGLIQEIGPGVMIFCGNVDDSPNLRSTVDRHPHEIELTTRDSLAGNELIDGDPQTDKGER